MDAIHNRMSLMEDSLLQQNVGKTKPQEIVSTNVDVLRLVLMGKTGSGKSSTGNTIIGRNVFESMSSATSVTNACQKHNTTINGQKVEVVDTPDFFDTTVPTEKVTQEISRCVTMTTPGPHAFLFVASVGRFTEEEINTVKLVVRQFGENVKNYMIVVFSCVDELEESLDSYLDNAPTYLNDFIKTCDKRYIAIDNKNKPHGQVSRILDLINQTVKQNGNRHYTNAMYKENADMLRAREEDLRRKHAAEEKRKIQILEAKYRDKFFTEEMKYKKEIDDLRRDNDNHQKEVNRLREATSAKGQSLEVKELFKFFKTLSKEVFEQGCKHKENMRSLQPDMNKKSKQEIEILQKNIEIEKEQLGRETADSKKRSDAGIEMMMTFIKQILQQQNEHHEKQIDLLKAQQNELDMMSQQRNTASDALQQQTQHHEKQMQLLTSRDQKELDMMSQQRNTASDALQQQNEHHEKQIDLLNSQNQIEFDKMSQQRNTASDDQPSSTDIKTNGMTLMEYCIDAFPRLKYNFELYKDFIRRRELQHFATNDLEKRTSFLVIAAGDTGTKGHVQLISKKNGRKIETDYSDFHSSSHMWEHMPLVYFLRDDESVLEASKRVRQISSQVPKAFESHGIFVSHNATKNEELLEIQGDIFVIVPYSKNAVRQVVSNKMEKPIFESLHTIENYRSNLDMQTYLEVQTLLKHEIREPNIAVQSWEEMIPQAVVDTLTRQKEITAFGIWQDKFFVFLKTLSSVGVQSEINSMLRETDNAFFNEMTPKYFYTDDFLVTKYIRQGDALIRRDDNVGMVQGATASSREKTGTVGALLRNTVSKEKVYGLTSYHLLPKTNIPAFTKGEGILDPCANCILSFNRPDMAFIEFEKKFINLCVTAFHDETDKPRRTKVYHDSLANVGMVHKKGAISNWTKGMLISPETHARITEMEYFKQCIFVEGTSGHFSSPGDSGSVIFAHSPDHSHLQALGIVAAGDLKITDTELLEHIGRTESDLKKMTIAHRLQPGFDKARKSEPSFNFEFEDVKSSSSESDEDSSLESDED